MKKNIFIHPTAIIDKGAKIKKNTFIWHWTHLSGTARIGQNCTIGQNVYIGENVIIGNNVKIQNNVSIFDGVRIEDDVFCGPSVVFTNIKFPRAFINQKKRYIKTIVKKGSSIGANSTIICGNNIGSFAFVGAGSVVTKNVKSKTLVFGNPAKYIKKIK